MRDIFEELFPSEPLDPVAAARRGLRTPPRKRFYKDAEITKTDGGYALALDGRPVKTPARRPLVAPARPLAQALADEWQAQRDVIDPAAMPLTRLANTIIDAVAEAPLPVVEDVARYLGSDLVCYRASAPQPLVESQARHWDPVVAFARDRLGARFVLGEGLAHVAQPATALAAARAAVPQPTSPGGLWRLGAVHSVTTLTGSALLALALAHGAISVDAAWAAAHVDEDWNIAQWGRDPEALARRAYRKAEMQAAATALRLSEQP